MAAYRRVDDLRLTACTPGSAPGPAIGVEYGKPLLFCRKLHEMPENTLKLSGKVREKSGSFI